MSSHSPCGAALSTFLAAETMPRLLSFSCALGVSAVQPFLAATEDVWGSPAWSLSWHALLYCPVPLSDS